jgi:hypothetical protein
MRSLVAALLVALPGGSGPSPAPPQAPPPGSRQAIEVLERKLDHAIARVSLPHSARLLGHDATRGFRLPGYGLVLVLAPRALPGGSGFVYRLGTPGRRVRLRSRSARPEAPEPPGDLESVERHVIILQHETEQTRSEAERDMERIVNDLRIRHAPREGVPAEPAEAGEPPTPVAAPPQGVPPPDEPSLPPPPPWKFWFEGGTPHDERTPEALVADVRHALVEALASQRGRLPGLLPEESVTVAVDFEPAGLFESAGPARTLIVRVRVRDIAARGRGAISVEELRRRIEVSEY